MINPDEDRPDLVERYAAATSASSLQVRAGRCAVDYLAAAGWAREDFGARLLRLRIEFDSVRADFRRVDGRLGAYEEAIDRQTSALAAVLKKKDPTPQDRAGREECMREIDRIRAERRAYLLGERQALQVAMRHLQPVYEVMHSLAVATAIVMELDQPAEAVRAIAQRVIDAWLDPLCPGCDGRGYNGGRHRGEQRVTCRACRGMRMRSNTIAENAEQARLVRALSDEVATAFFGLQAGMRARLRDTRSADD